MKIAAIAGSTIPSDTANSLQVMKACQALVQTGHEVTLFVPGAKKTSINLQQHYGLQTDFPIEWLSSSSRRLFTWDAVRRPGPGRVTTSSWGSLKPPFFQGLTKSPATSEFHPSPPVFSAP